VMAAPGMRAPDESEITPVTRDVVPWAHASDIPDNRAIANKAGRRRQSLCMKSPSPNRNAGLTPERQATSADVLPGKQPECYMGAIQASKAICQGRYGFRQGRFGAESIEGRYEGWAELRPARPAWPMAWAELPTDTRAVGLIARIVGAVLVLAAMAGPTA
jgi:hypothetical protein